MTTEATLNIARNVRIHFAGSALTQRQAKLYSQRLRRDMQREGLTTFLTGDVEKYMEEATLLLQCALIERAANPNSPWRVGVKRAAEILEWLSQSSLRPKGVPVHFLAAAAYQLADYPAMALGHLRRMPDEEPFSVLLREFLRANFPTALEESHKFLQDQIVMETNDRIDIDDLTYQSIRHTVMCIGVICNYLRDGNDWMVERAVVKLDHLAAGFLHSRDSYSYVLAKLTAATARRFVSACLWPQISQLQTTSGTEAGAALVQYARSAFLNRRSLVWPAQAAGIERLRENNSFVLCTPTGSGKTTVATLAVVQGLFTRLTDVAPELLSLESASLVLYLVPSRALAAEVEARLAEDLQGISSNPVIVTGLYGGIDWGPTDAWLQSDRATIVICTFEKADALVRYLGVLFLSRVRTVVIDEAHMVEQDENRLDDLINGGARSFRLEQLGARLLKARDEYNFRIVALSAVAAGAAPAIARWLSGNSTEQPTSSDYRSTRQMIGRIEVSQGGSFSIHYDLMNGHSLEFEDDNAGVTPYVPSPFTPMPSPFDRSMGPDLRMRAPTLWSALQLAAARPDGNKPAVLISITQNIEPFAETCADLMDRWPLGQLPNFRDIDETDERWIRCLAIAADYFGETSYEYRLLVKGIAVHHGKMPGLLARRLKVLIDSGVVRVIVATSTLSEGVNIPVNYVLIPSVHRAQNEFTLQEFSNLVGRAGRPGVSTEGSALVILEDTSQWNRQRNAYNSLINQVRVAAATVNSPNDAASSPLAHLITSLEQAWRNLTGLTSAADFEAWLEQTAVTTPDTELTTAVSLLDSLDSFLIAAIQEIEDLRQRELQTSELEDELAAIWRKTYAYAATNEESDLNNIWITRGKVIKDRYPDAVHRRNLYKTSLSPRSAVALLEIQETIKTKLQEGVGYAYLSQEEKLVFVKDVLSLLSSVPSFHIATRLGRRNNFQDWPKLLRWWLAKGSLPQQPTPKEITNWYDFVAKNFIYRGAWGLGSVIGLLLDLVDEDGEPLRALEMDDWPRSGLPWIAFWMKELITWGTLEPVAAFLLARGNAIDRPHAEVAAGEYYETLPVGLSANDALDPRRIREWLGTRQTQQDSDERISNLSFHVQLVRDVQNYQQSQLAVFPVAPPDTDGQVFWIDPAGYTVATSNHIDDWIVAPSSFSFVLHVSSSQIVGEPYLSHR
jgi:hypothetical protein